MGTQPVAGDYAFDYYTCPACARCFVVVILDRTGKVADRLHCSWGCTVTGFDPATGALPGEPVWMRRAGCPHPDEWPVRVPRTPHAEFYRPGDVERRLMKQKAPKLWRYVALEGGLILRPPTRAYTFPARTVQETAPTGGSDGGDGEGEGARRQQAGGAGGAAPAGPPGGARGERAQDGGAQGRRGEPGPTGEEVDVA